MDYNTLVQLIGSLGFPIAACCALFWMINSTMKENTESNREVRTALTELVSYMRERDPNVC